MRWQLKHFVVGFLLLGTAGLALVYFVHRGQATIHEGTPEEGAKSGIPVKTVHPQANSNFELTVDRPANVKAYYRSPIEARVAGEVQWIHVAPGSNVKKGELLVRILVPDLDAAEKEKKDLIGQREKEWQVAKAKVVAAEKAVDTAEANIKEKKTLLTEAQATTAYRAVQFKRLNDLLTQRSVEPIAVDEAQKNLDVARALEASADAARIKAEAEREDARVNVKVMEAERNRSEQLVQVAKTAHEAAAALAEYARVKAPWDGTVVNRHVDPGSFVQNASTGHPTPLVTLERTDIVTVVMRVPDNVAPFVKDGTVATLELDELPGIKIQGRVTRRSGSLETSDRDRTMRVEVDLWNSDPSNYEAFLAANYNGDKPKAGAEVKDGLPPLLPTFVGEDPLGRSRRLLSDMYGKMTLVLKTFGDCKLIPSVAVLHEGGRALVYVVEQGKAHRVPIKVQMDDGNLAKVVLLDDKGRVRGELTGKEAVIVSNQEELSEGAPVAGTSVSVPD
jgi:multidrug resistance efflux pump